MKRRKFTKATPDNLFVVGYSPGGRAILGHVNLDFTNSFKLRPAVAVLDRWRGKWRACTHYVEVPREMTSRRKAAA